MFHPELKKALYCILIVMLLYCSSLYDFGEIRSEKMISISTDSEALAKEYWDKESKLSAEYDSGGMYNYTSYDQILSGRIKLAEEMRQEYGPQKFDFAPKYLKFSVFLIDRSYFFVVTLYSIWFLIIAIISFLKYFSPRRATTEIYSNDWLYLNFLLIPASVLISFMLEISLGTCDSGCFFPFLTVILGTILSIISLVLTVSMHIRQYTNPQHQKVKMLFSLISFTLTYGLLLLLGIALYQHLEIVA